ncbi:MAG: hypothetical protein QM744_02460 [Mesorhizobium sp.]
MTEPLPAPFDIPSDVGGKDIGIFMPIANGGWILSKNAPMLDGSYDYNLQGGQTRRGDRSRLHHVDGEVSRLWRRDRALDATRSTPRC